MKKTIFTLVLFLFAFRAMPALAQEQDYPVTMTPCPPGVISTFIQQYTDTVECGAVTVPLNYEEPAGDKVDLAFAILHSHSLSPAPDPVIYLHGGPGSAELHTLSPDLTERFDKLRQRRDIVIFDQRGAGYSLGELNCALGTGEEIQAGLNSGKLSQEEFFNAVFAQCLQTLAARAVDLAAYTTPNNARDVDNLAHALGYDTYNLYGVSYGTKLGLEVIRQHPAGLRTVVLDSVAPPNVKLYERMGEGPEQSFINIAAMCQADADCAAAYPDLVDRLNALFAQLDEAPIAAKPPVTSAYLAAILGHANSPKNVWQVAYFPRLIYDLEQGDTTVWMGLVDGSLQPPEEPTPFLQNIDNFPPTARTLIETALKLAQEAQSLTQTAEELLNESEQLVLVADDSLASLFLRTLDERRPPAIDATEDYDYHRDLLFLSFQEPEQDVVRAFVTNHFIGLDADNLLSIVAEMTPADIEELYRQIRFDPQSMVRAANTNNYFLVKVMICNEEVPFSSLEGVAEEIANYRIPGLARSKGDILDDLVGGCDLYPTGTVPASFHEPVTGDGSVPVLILSGTNDTQTATTWADALAETLVGAQFIRFPNAGHAVIRFSECAKDIGAAFIDNPQAEVNSACTADLKPHFVLPE